MRRIALLLFVFAFVAARPVGAEVPDAFDTVCSLGGPGVCGTYYRDADRDGFGDPSTARKAPLAGEGEVAMGLDCDDTDPGVHPGAPEAFDGRDQDCDGSVDEANLVITELMSDPEAVADATGEWIEITNASQQAARLDGVALVVGTRGCDLGSRVVEARGRVVAARSLDSSQNGGVPADVLCLAQLTNSGTVVVLRTAPRDLDVVDYRGWDVPAGASLSLNPAANEPDENDVPAAWCAAKTVMPSGDRGTPKAANDSCS